MKTPILNGPAAFRPDRTSRTAVFLRLMAGALALALICSLFPGKGYGAPPVSLFSDPNYREGFGKGATGGAGYSTCTVTSAAESGPGTFDSCFQPGSTAGNKTIVFAVGSVTLPGNRYVGSNVTIDGCANGMNGVTVDQMANTKRGLVVSGGASNVIIQCLNLRGTGTPSSRATEFDNLALDGDTPTPISNVFIDRITSMQASDGALDITGNVENVTVQRSLFYGNAITMLIKYDRRRNISIHHNVFTRNGERNPQVKGDMQLFDFVNNVIYLNDVPNYPDGSATDPYGTRILSCGSGCDSPGDVVANIVNNAYIGPGTDLLLETGPGGGSNSGTYIGGNHCDPASNCPASPKATPNTIPAAYAVATLATGALKSQLLPYVGSPNRTTLDQQRIDAVAAALPDDGTPPAPTAALSASPTRITSGQSATLTWSTTDATTVSIDQGIGTVTASGSRNVRPAVTTTYTLTASNASGAVRTSVTITVDDAPPTPPRGLRIVN